jgi:hypothetical protein
MSLKLAADLFLKPPKTGDGVVADFRTVELATADEVTSQLYAIGILPAGYRLRDFAVETDDLDSGGSPAAAFSVGVLNAFGNGWYTANGLTPYDDGETTIQDAGYTAALISGMNLITTSTIGQAGGRADNSLPIMNNLGVVEDYDRIIALQFTTVPATAQAGTFSISMLMAKD